MRPSEIPFFDCVDNITLFTRNRCGMTHGLLDVGWNLAGVGSEVFFNFICTVKKCLKIIFSYQVSCNFFAPNKNVPGTDLRSLDYQVGREFGEPHYGEILIKWYGVKKCIENITKTDFRMHTGEDSARLSKLTSELGKVGYTLATDFENKDGQILSPTNSKIIVEQLRRTVCGDRFWFSNGNVFNDGKIFFQKPCYVCYFLFISSPNPKNTKPKFLQNYLPYSQL